MYVRIMMYLVNSNEVASVKLSSMECGVIVCFLNGKKLKDGNHVLNIMEDDISITRNFQAKPRPPILPDH